MQIVRLFLLSALVGLLGCTSFPGLCGQPHALPLKNQTQDGFRGIWFTLGQFSKHGDKYSGGLGTYTANHNPIAVYSEKAGKTFFTYGGTIKGSRHLLIMAAAFDHKTGEVTRPVVVHDKEGVDDPHDNGSITLDKDGHVWIFVSGRGRARPGFKYRSREPLSVAAFEQVSREEMTYPQPWFIEGRGWVHLFTKYTRGRELYWETSTDGRTWTADRKLAGFGGHYQVSGRHGRRVATFFNYHPGGNVDRRTNLYYAETEDGGETWKSIKGEELALPLAEIKNSALVIDYESQGTLAYTCDLNFDVEGRPILLYVTSRGPEPGPENGPREFRVTRWDGKAWQTSTVTTTDHNYDMGSLWVEPNRWTVIAPTAPGPQPYGTGGEMCLWSSIDSGQTWSMQVEITRDSPRNHSYARRPLNAADPFYAFWADGDPRQFSESHLYFCDSTGKRVGKLPYDMGATAETARILPLAQPSSPGDTQSEQQRVLRRFGARDTRVHDPSTIVKCKDRYWLFSTGNGILSRHSRDLTNWTDGPRVFANRLPEWHTNAVPGNRGHLWAPDIIRLNDRYLLYYSVSTFGRNTSAIGLATNRTLDPDDPGYAWMDHGLVVQSSSTNDYNAIDPAVMLDRGGRLWLSFGSFWTGIKMIELDPSTGKRHSPDSPLYPLAHYKSIEAPHIYQHGRYYYLFVNWDTCCRGLESTYNIRVGRSEQITGPYVDRDGKNLLEGGGSLLLGTTRPFIGPGHAAIFPDGDREWFSCHFYDGTTPRGTSKLAILPLRWGSDDWPELVVPGN